MLIINRARVCETAKSFKIDQNASMNFDVHAKKYYTMLMGESGNV